MAPVHWSIYIPFASVYAAPWRRDENTSLTADLTNAGFELTETGMYPKKARSYFVVARNAP